ncbi:MAG: hypothetical protein ACK55Z_27950, partial [bacterium]
MPRSDHLLPFWPFPCCEDVELQLTQIVVELPLLEPLDPPCHVQHAAHELLVVSATEGGRDEGHNMHSVVEGLGESNVLRDETLGVAHASLFHE